MAGFKTLPKKFTSWSNTRWNDYAQCPARAHWKHIDKLPEPKSAPMARGIEMARIEEAYFKGELKTLPVWRRFGKVESPKGIFVQWEGNLKQAERDGLAIHKDLVPLFQKVKKCKDLIVEDTWAFRKDWSVTSWDDWTGCWLRVKVDICWGCDSGVKILHIVDNKTGKYNEYDIDKYMEQLRLYAAAGAARFPHILEFHVRLWFTDLGLLYPTEGPLMIKRAEALKLQKKFTKQVIPMFMDTRFDPKPNHGCQWCAYRNEIGGPCKY